VHAPPRLDNRNHDAADKAAGRRAPMSTPLSGAGESRSLVRVQRIRGGEHVWQIVVVAADDTPAALREAVRLARDLDGQLSDVYVKGVAAATRNDDDPDFPF
jgi:hypothetical protein